MSVAGQETQESRGAKGGAPPRPSQQPCCVLPGSGAICATAPLLPVGGAAKKDRGECRPQMAAAGPCYSGPLAREEFLGLNPWAACAGKAQSTLLSTQKCTLSLSRAAAAAQRDGTTCSPEPPAITLCAAADVPSARQPVCGGRNHTPCAQKSALSLPGPLKRFASPWVQQFSCRYQRARSLSRRQAGLSGPHQRRRAAQSPGTGPGWWHLQVQIVKPFTLRPTVWFGCQAHILEAGLQPAHAAGSMVGSERAAAASSRAQQAAHRWRWPRRTRCQTASV